jgi:hypothetical protein
MRLQAVDYQVSTESRSILSLRLYSLKLLVNNFEREIHNLILALLVVEFRDGTGTGYRPVAGRPVFTGVSDDEYHRYRFSFFLGSTSLLETFLLASSFALCSVRLRFMSCFRERMLSTIPFFLFVSFSYICVCFVLLGGQFPFCSSYSFFFSHTHSRSLADRLTTGRPGRVLTLKFCFFHVKIYKTSVGSQEYLPDNI